MATENPGRWRERWGRFSQARRWSIVLKPFGFIEWGLEWAAYGLRNLALFEVLGNLARLSILVGAISYLAGGELRRKQAEDQRLAKHYQAWQAISAANNQSGSGGRKDALELLFRDGVSLTGVDVCCDAYLSLLDLFDEELGVTLDHSNFDGADLTGADLTTAQFRRATLKGADLREAKLAGASFDFAILANADFSRADVAGTRFADADLSGAILTGANLRGVYLRKASLEGAHLEGADLTEANLYGADLREVKFSQKTDLSRADMRLADLRNADLSGTSVTPDQISLARRDSTTTLVTEVCAELMGRNPSAGCNGLEPQEKRNSQQLPGAWSPAPKPSRH